jgi:predicted MFS family arabinose efflux permease
VKQWSIEKSIRFLPYAVFVATFERTVIAPMLLGMARDFNVTLATITLSASAYLLFYGLAQPVWGLISDRLGRTATLQLALVLAGVMNLISIIPMGIEPFIALRAIAGASMAGVFPAAMIFIGDTVKNPKDRQPAIASLQTGVALALTLGTVLGGIGIVTIGWQAFFVITALCSFIVAIVVRAMPNPKPGDERLPVKTSFKIVLSNPWSWVLFALVFVEAGVLLGAFALIPSAMETEGSSAILAGAVTGAYGIAVLFTSIIVRRTAARTSRARLLAIGGTCASLGFLLIGFSVSPLIVVISVALQGASWVYMHTTLQTWVTMLTDVARATAISLFAGFMFLGNGAGAQISSLVLENFGAAPLFLGAFGTTVALTVFAVLSSRRYEHRLG